MVDTASRSATYALGWRDPIQHVRATEKGLHERVTGDLRSEEQILRDAPVPPHCLPAFRELPTPTYGGNGELADIDFGEPSWDHPWLLSEPSIEGPRDRRVNRTDGCDT